MSDREPRIFEPAAVRVIDTTSSIEHIVATAFDEHAGRLKAFAIAVTREPDAADDVVQEAFLRLVREVRGGRTPDNIGGWLLRVAANLMASRGRRLSVAERKKPALVDRGFGDSPESLAVERERDRELVAALGELPEDARVALLMAGRGMSSEEIARAIGRTTIATRTFICRYRLRLREVMARAGGGRL